MLMPLSIQTSVCESSMKHELCKLIELSTKNECDRKITSCFDGSSLDFKECVVGKYKGIIVSPEIYESLQKNGVIYQYVYETFGLKLKTTKISGRAPRELEEKGFSRLSSISW